MRLAVIDTIEAKENKNLQRTCTYIMVIIITSCQPIVVVVIVLESFKFTTFPLHDNYRPRLCRPFHWEAAVGEGWAQEADSVAVGRGYWQSGAVSRWVACQLQIAVRQYNTCSTHYTLPALHQNLPKFGRLLYIYII